MESSYLCYPHHICPYNPLNIAALRNIQLIVPDALVYSMFMINAMTGTRTIVKPDSKNYLDDSDNNLATNNTIDEIETDWILSHE
jgi:hypothetical protein